MTLSTLDEVTDSLRLTRVTLGQMIEIGQRAGGRGLRTPFHNVTDPSAPPHSVFPGLSLSEWMSLSFASLCSDPPGISEWVSKPTLQVQLAPSAHPISHSDHRKGLASLSWD